MSKSFFKSDLNENCVLTFRNTMKLHNTKVVVVDHGRQTVKNSDHFTSTIASEKILPRTQDHGVL